MSSGRRMGNKSGKSYGRALQVLARMRRTGQTLSAASREEHTDPRTVRKYVRGDLKRLKKGGYTVATKSDRRHRRDMLIPTALGTANAVVRGSREASQLGRYMSAVGTYLRTGEAGGLTEFAGQSIADHPSDHRPRPRSRTWQKQDPFNWSPSTPFRSLRHEERDSLDRAARRLSKRAERDRCSICGRKITN